MTFESFYEDRRDFPLFPWMVRLAERFASNDLPEVIDLPTGSGKSDLTLIWAWARKQNANLPRRLWMVSDRRVIVDQTYDVTSTLAADGIIVSRLRGGIESDTTAIRDPIVPQIISATMDQFGSRLLFRGYGSGSRSWPIWAGLAGNDSLVVLDEAHLSPTAEDTFRACYRLGADVRIISVTATPRLDDDAQHFSLDELDRAHPELGRRLQARRIVEIRKKGSLEGMAHEFLGEGCKRVALVCNTVREARRVFEAVQHTDKHLLIGRQRPLDRDRILKDLLPRVRSGAAESEPLVVVATQCIEAGADFDFDFDSTATEACPIDALRQRLGRLDRLGNQGESRCILFKPPPGRDGVPPYGAAPNDTWRWLVKNAKKGRIDLGAEGWAEIGEFVPDKARSARPDVVTFLEPHLRILSRTSPRPYVEPDVDLLLHGPHATAGAVTFVWRRDIECPDIVDRAERRAATNEILQLVPPNSLEGCELPLREAQTWLAHPHQQIEVDTGDVEGGQTVDASEVSGCDREVICWQGKGEDIVPVKIDQLAPGSVIVLRCDVGGYEPFGWVPASPEPVQDIADDTFYRRQGCVIERVDTDPDVAEIEKGRIGYHAHRWARGVVFEQLADGKHSRIVEREILLDGHRKRVADKAREYAESLGLNGETRETLYSAGWHHDCGKADPGWQLLVNGCNPAALQQPALAKGPFVRCPLSCLPRGWRHEAKSFKDLPRDASDLVQWLVATHHGYARPFWPIPEHDDIGRVDMMDRLQLEHGYWTLALLEAVLKCADQKISEEEMADA
ncbi:MAG: type I-U CRISPR-associated helicase/endonuclease Cas3 [Hyphomicrobiaceae bacterium]